MVNKNYRKGYSFEKRVQKYFEENGYYVIRAAGSHGAADLVVIRPYRIPIFVQCKYNRNITSDEKMKLRKICDNLNVKGVIAFGKAREPVRFIDVYTGMESDYI